MAIPQRYSSCLVFSLLKSGLSYKSFSNLYTVYLNSSISSCLNKTFIVSWVEIGKYKYQQSYSKTGRAVVVFPDAAAVLGHSHRQKWRHVLGACPRGTRTPFILPVSNDICRHDDGCEGQRWFIHILWEALPKSNVIFSVSGCDTILVRDLGAEAESHNGDIS